MRCKDNNSGKRKTARGSTNQLGSGAQLRGDCQAVSTGEELCAVFAMNSATNGSGLGLSVGGYEMCMFSSYKFI